MNWIPLEKRDRFPALAKENSKENSEEKKNSLFFPGGGYTKALYEQA